MSDIFISYASADRERAKMMSEVLAERGWSVWWDRTIPPGRQFDEVIEEALDAAKCVVVLWSQASVASTWVKTEAAEATRGKALIPALIEEVKIPLEFRRLQAADLSRWKGDRSDPQLLQFFQSIEAALKRSGDTGESSRTDKAAGDIGQETRAEPQPPPAPRPGPEVKHTEPASKRKLSPAVIGGIVAVVVALLGGAIYYQRSTTIAAAEKAAAEKAVGEKAAAEKAAAEKAARLAEQRKAGEERMPAKRPAPARTQQGVPASGTMNLQWRDHALAFSGSLTWSPSSAMLRVNVTDMKTGTRIGNYAVPALISQQGPAEYIVSADFAVPGDSATPGPHTHTSRLRVRAEQDGSLRFLQNCPRQGECY